MDILKNLNERLSIVEGEACFGGEDYVNKVLNMSPIKLPTDYIEFLKNISGGNDTGVSFIVDNEESEINIWNAEIAIQKHDEFYEPDPDNFFDKIWLVGDDLGDLIYFYGEGKDGFGLYRDEVSTMCFQDAEKIADSLTDFLVKGIGIDIAISL